MADLPGPLPVLWAPRTRKWLTRFFTRMDRRKAALIAARENTAIDWRWRQAYQQWWLDQGWADGAPPVEKYLDARAWTTRWHQQHRA